MSELEEIKRRMLNTVRETIAYYDHPDKAGWDPEDGTCVYRNSETKSRCAVGRCLNVKETPNFIFNCTGDVADVVSALSEHQDHTLDDYLRDHTLDDYLKKKYRGFPLPFWQKLQTLHDNWCDVLKYKSLSLSEYVTNYNLGRVYVKVLYNYIDEIRAADL